MNGDLFDLLDWCDNNFQTGEWTYAENPDLTIFKFRHDNYHFHFINEENLVQFKLVWD